jgi:DNA-binding transcriptional LysR family regulator
VDIRQLRQVLAIHQHGSFAKAAHSLAVSQPSLSRSVARLEDELRAPLFARSASGSELTPLGEMVVAHASRVLDETRSLMQAAELAVGGEAGLIRIGIGPAMKRTLAPRLVGEIARRHPKLNVEVEVGDRYTLVPALGQRQLDVIICALDPEVVACGHPTTEIMSTFGVAVASPGHPLTGEKRVSRTRFAQFPSVGPRNVNFRVDTVFGFEPSDRQGATYTTNDFEPVMPLVTMGQATMLIPAFEAAPFVRSGQLCQVNVELDLPMSLVVVATRAVSSSPLVQRIIGYAREIGADLAAGQDILRR